MQYRRGPPAGADSYTAMAIERKESRMATKQEEPIRVDDRVRHKDGRTGIVKSTVGHMVGEGEKRRREVTAFIVLVDPNDTVKGHATSSWDAKDTSAAPAVEG